MDINLFMLIALILVVSRIFEEAFSRLGQPQIIGDLLAGVLLGPLILDVISSNEILSFFGLLGVIFLMVIAGLDISLKDIKGITGTASMITIFSSMIPIAAGIALGTLAGLNIFESVIIGVAISITSSAITTEILEELGYLKRKVGWTLIEAGIFDDIISLFTITTLIGALEYSSFAESIAAYEIHLIKIVVFFILSIMFGYYILPKIMDLTKWMKSTESSFAISLIMIMAFAGVSEYFGMHALIGAFISGISLNHYLAKKEMRKNVFEDDIRSFAEGFLTPIFFVLIGAEITISGLLINPYFTIVLILVGILSKFMGGFIGSALGGMEKLKDRVAIGSGMMAKGSVTLVVVHIINTAASKNPSILPNAELIISSLVIMVLVVDIIAPVLFKKSLDL